MPVEGLPITLEGALSTLIKGNPLTSFKIDGRGDNIVVVLRFSTGQPNDTAARRYRLKPPSQQARDKRRAGIRKGQVSGDRSPMPLFMPTPPSQLAEKSHEINYMTSHLTGLHQRDKTFQDYIARESRSAAAEVTLDSECFVCDIEQLPDVKSGAMQQAGEGSKCDKINAVSFDWSSGANISEETEEYIGKTMDRGLQRRLRSKTRNKIGPRCPCLCQHHPVN